MFWFYFCNVHVFPNLLLNTCAENKVEICQINID